METGKALYDSVCRENSKHITKRYSTSFSLGISFLDQNIQDAIYSIYGFVRLADEIVDSFHNYPKAYLLDKFEKDTYEAIEMKISLNPVLNAFQEVVHEYQVKPELIDAFLKSMRMDLEEITYDSELYKTYIYGSANVVGLMCLQVFVNGDHQKYDELKYSAEMLGSAFQKINFLRDLKADNEVLQRVYFPNIDLTKFTEKDKIEIMKDIEHDFSEALIGIKQLPSNARFGVYMAYRYYFSLFKKIKKTPAERILKERIRVPNIVKYNLFFSSYMKHNLKMI